MMNGHLHAAAQARGNISVGALHKGDYFGERALLRKPEDFTSRCDT